MIFKGSWPERRHHSILLLAGLLVGSCSRTTEFFVVNLTTDSVVVHYTLKPSADCDPVAAEPLVLPVTVNIKPGMGRIDPSDIELSEDAPTSAVINSTCAAVVVNLPAKNAVRVAALSNYRRPDLPSWHRFPLDSIEIKTPSASLRHCGPSALLAFEGGSRGEMFVFRATPGQMTSGICAVSPNPSLQRTPPG